MDNNLNIFFKNKRALITGHTGFKGSWLTQILLNMGARVCGISLSPHTKPNLFSVLGIKKEIIHHIADIRNFKKIKTIFKEYKPEIVFHLAAQAIVRESYDNPLYTHSTNILGTTNILEALREIKNIRAVVMITTDKIYENRGDKKFYTEEDPLGSSDPYSSSKAAADLVIQSYIKSFFNPVDFKKKHATLIAIARAGNVIGGGDWGNDRLITDIVRAVFENKKKLSIRNPHAIRPWQHVFESLTGYLMLARELYNGNTKAVGAWNFGPLYDNSVTVGNILKQTFSILGARNWKIIPDNSKPEANFLKLDSTKAINVLGWNPRFNTKDALAQTFEWYKTFYHHNDNIIDLTNQHIKNFFNV